MRLVSTCVVAQPAFLSYTSNVLDIGREIRTHTAHVSSHFAGLNMTRRAGFRQLIKFHTQALSLPRRCGVCQIGVKGEKEAVEHAKTTGHQNFSEYH